jgi:hypothetical protein
MDGGQRKARPEQPAKSVKSVESVVSLFLFILIGVLTAAVGELQYSVLIRGDWANLLRLDGFQCLLSERGVCT